MHECHMHTHAHKQSRRVLGKICTRTFGINNRDGLRRRWGAVLSRSSSWLRVGCVAGSRQVLAAGLAAASSCATMLSSQTIWGPPAVMYAPACGCRRAQCDCMQQGGSHPAHAAWHAASRPRTLSDDPTAVCAREVRSASCFATKGGAGRARSLLERRLLCMLL